AATYGLAATLFAHHPTQVVITGRADDPLGQSLGAAAHGVFRYGKAVLRVSAAARDRGAPGSSMKFAGALEETLPHLPSDQALALVCSGESCLPPTSDPVQLTAVLGNTAAPARASR